PGHAAVGAVQQDRAGPAGGPELPAGPVNGVQVPAGDDRLGQLDFRVAPRGAAVLAEQDEATLADRDGAPLFALAGVDRLDGPAGEGVDGGGHDLALADAGEAVPGADEGGVLVGEFGGVPAGAARAGQRLPGAAAVLGHEDAAGVLVAAVAD